MNEPLHLLKVAGRVDCGARNVRAPLVLSLCFTMAFTAGLTGAQKPTPPPQSTVRWHDVSRDEYRLHLKALSTLVDTCQTARDIKGCDPALVGPDDRVPVAVNLRAEPRLVRFGWLRVLLSRAEDPDPPASTLPSAPKGGKARVGDPSAIAQLLTSAKARLESDLAESSAADPALPSHAQAHAAMQQVLAEAEFRNLNQASVRDSALEKLGNKLNQLYESVVNFKARSAWIGRTLVWGFVVVVCVALVYALIRLERRWRVMLTPDGDLTAPEAASARDWQLWLEDARGAASSGLWREAIHLMYWAAISRLESRRLWPADRARTPREYLALLASDDPRKPGLSLLTSTFERTWYGGRAAVESDFTNAESLASTLISGSTPAGTGKPKVASRGGVR